MVHKTAASRRAPARRKPVPAEVALVALFAAADCVRVFVADVVGPHGITGQQYNVLRILRGAEPDGLPTLTIAQRMIERAPGITRMIDRLETKDLVERERRGGDRRCVHVRITRAGLGLLDRLDAPIRRADRAAFAALDDRELARLAALLERVRASHARGPRDAEDPE
jgi:DNA-binding MarR family transcriptional regulator